MKTTSKSLRRLACVCAVLCGILNCSATDFEVDGLTYTVLSEAGKTCSLTGHTTLTQGTLTIPAKVTDENGTEYSVVAIGKEAFVRGSAFTGDLVIPEGVTSIGPSAFNGCYGLNGKLTLPSTLTVIGELAFNQCRALTDTLRLPEGLTSLGYGAFTDCAKLVGPLTVPGGVKKIEPTTFMGCVKLDSILTIGEGIVSIGEKAFAGCSSLNDSLALPESLEIIGNEAFANCVFADSLALPAGLKAIGTKGFYECSGFTKSLVVPDGVLTIGANAFEGCTGFTGFLQLPAALTTVETGVFSGCEGFTGKLVIPAGVTSIGDEAFWQCVALSDTLFLPSRLKTIGKKAFFSCRKLEGDLIIPEGVTEVGSSAFYNCDGFKGKLSLPSTLISIGKNAFDCCTGLTGKLLIPESVNFIGSEAFRRCYNLTGDLRLPANLTEVESGTFYYCFGLNGTLTIPENVTTIGNEAFYDCNNLSSVIVLHPLPPTLGEKGFSAVSYSTIPLHVPLENIEDYQNADEWKNFETMEGFDIVPVTSIELDTAAITIGQGGEYQLIAKILPEDATFKGVTWSSSDENVAVVENGLVSGISTGEATITATASSGDIATCTVTVDETIVVASGLKVDPSNAIMQVSDRMRLKALIEPSNTEDKSVTWESDEPTVATVNSEGLVEAISPGRARITATTGNNIEAWCSITVVPRIYEVTKLSVNPADLTLEVEEKYELDVIYSPDYATDRSVVWISENDTIVTVDAKGLITALAPGKTNITVTATNGVQAKCRLTVKEKTVYADSVIISATTLKIEQDQTAQLTATLLPENVTDTTITWKSSDVNVCTVDTAGVVKAIIPGRATVTATAAGGAQASCAVTVTAKFIEIESLTLTPDATTVELGKNLRLSATIRPYNATTKTLTWKSDNESVATVDGSGLVRGADLGTANIICTAANGMTATCVITVVPVTDAIEGINGDASTAVKVDGNRIIMPRGSEVFDLNGRRVTTQSLQPGIYIVRIPGGKSVKVQVR